MIAGFPSKTIHARTLGLRRITTNADSRLRRITTNATHVRGQTMLRSITTNEGYALPYRATCQADALPFYPVECVDRLVTVHGDMLTLTVISTSQMSERHTRDPPILITNSRGER